jgi:vancomycin resistance protein YoaR
MSLSARIKFLGTASLLTAGVFFASGADAAELKFNEQTWEVNPQVGTTFQAYVVRNDFDLHEFAKRSFGSHPYLTAAPSIDSATAKVLEDAAAKLNQPAKESKLVIEDGWAKEFEPGQDGQALDMFRAYSMIASGQEFIKLPVLVSKPNSSLADTNDLGINELVAVGESNFAGSPYNRRVNIRVGASRYQGLILKPGEEFSFNKILGDVDGEHGFLPELVIKKTGTVPEFGGGLCQVSSTAFRAAMNAGLPIVERRNHSYAVKYYAPQGTDATIYPGVTDFRFKNDLPSHLLMRTKIDGDKLFYEFYGTKDNRQITFDGPYQFDKKANGAMKAVWTRWVEKDGYKAEQVFNSTYQPPALFHTETQASTPNPQATTANPNDPNAQPGTAPVVDPNDDENEDPDPVDLPPVKPEPSA